MNICSKCKVAEKHNNYYCVDCQKAYSREHYLNNKEAYTNRRQERNKERYLWLFKYLKDHPCVDCGESDPIVLEFDHVGNDKIMNVSRVIRGYSWDKILAEISKCEVRCSNCHKRKTAKQFGWYSRYDYL